MKGCNLWSDGKSKREEEREEGKGGEKRGESASDGAKELIDWREEEGR